MTEITEMLEMAKRCEDRALYNTSGDPMRLLKEAADVMRGAAKAWLKNAGYTYPELGTAQAPRQENDAVFPGFRGNNDSG